MREEGSLTLNRSSVRCASIHRKIGTHVTKVYVLLSVFYYRRLLLHLNRKSLTLDQWSKEQVDVCNKHMNR